MSNEIHEYVLVSLSNLVPFSGTLYDEKGNQTTVSGNPFFVPENDFDDKELARLHASIEQEGILTPLLVRPAGQENFYEIISGYRRKKVCEELAKTRPEFRNVPVIIIYPCDDDTANSIITSSNVQRREIGLLETIKSCGRMYRALRHRGRKDEEVSTADTVSQILGLKPRTVRRYSQLLELPEEMLSIVGNKAKNAEGLLRLPIKAGEIFAGMSKEALEIINTLFMIDSELSISVEQAKKIKKFCRKRNVTVDEVKELIESTSLKERKVSAKRKFSLNYARINPYCEGMTDQEVEALIYELIENWGRYSK